MVGVSLSSIKHNFAEKKWPAHRPPRGKPHPRRMCAVPRKSLWCNWIVSVAHNLRYDATRLVSMCVPHSMAVSPVYREGGNGIPQASTTGRGNQDPPSMRGGMWPGAQLGGGLAQGSNPYPYPYPGSTALSPADQSRTLLPAYRTKEDHRTLMDVTHSVSDWDLSAKKLR